MNLRNYILLLVAVLIVGESLSVGQTTSRTVRKHREVVEDPIFTPELTRAEAAMDKKDYAAAEKDLLATTEKNPKNYRAWFDLGYIYNETERTPQAIDAYRKSVEADPTVFESALNLGILLARSSDPEAEKYLRQATTLKPTAHQEQGWYRAWQSLGTVLQKTKPAEAIEAFQNAAKLNPKEAEPHLSAAILLEQQNKIDEAGAEYRKAAELDPKSSEALAGMVNCYSKIEQYPEAEGALRKYISLQPDNVTAHVQLGRLLAREHKWDEATAELERGLKAKPGDLTALKEIISIYMPQKRFDDAVPHLRSALALAPNDADLHYWYGLCLLNQRKLAEAQNEIIAALKINPKFGEAYGDLAIVASDTKNYPLALQALDARAKLLPENPATYFLRATTYDHLRDVKNAKESYKKFLELADGRFPEEEWKAKHRLIALESNK